jgi:hypothetical protein
VVEDHSDTRRALEMFLQLLVSWFTRDWRTKGDATNTARARSSVTPNVLGCEIFGLTKRQAYHCVAVDSFDFENGVGVFGTEGEGHFLRVPWSPRERAPEPSLLP